MQSLEALRKKIASAEDLYTIVRTMKTLAMVNIRQYEKAVESSSDYYRTVELGLNTVLREGHDDLISGPSVSGGGAGILVFGSDQGLCGSFNEQIVSFALGFIDEREEMKEHAIACVGSRAYAVLEEKGRQAGELYGVPGYPGGITSLVQDLLLKLEEWQRRKKIGHVFIFHNRPLSNVSYKPNAIKVLPLDPGWAGSFTQKKWPSHILPVYTMDRRQLFSALVSEYIFVSLFRALAESMAGENAARLSSMQAAERNIEERLDDLGRSYRNQRQASITDELMDIVSGFEALRSS
jgi:F-type H+-transporting ATPase subunit gamma